MNPTEQAILAANTIVRHKNDRFFCSVCTKMMSCDWKSHSQNRHHIFLLERFNASFEKLGDHPFCAICRTKVEWRDMKTHAISHKIVPWYDPPEKYKIFYENHTLKFRTMFYCYLCDEIYPEWSAAFIHLSEKRHAKLRKHVPRTSPLKTTKRVYNDWISFGFAPGKAQNIDCKMCNVSLSYRNGIEHIKDVHHRERKSKFICNLLDRIGIKGDLLKTENSGSSLSEETSKRPIIDNSKENRKPIIAEPLRPMICNFFVEPKISEKQEIKSDESVEEQWFSNNFPKWNIETSPKNFPKSEYISEPRFFDTPMNFIVRSDDDLCKEAIEKATKKRKRKIIEQENTVRNPFCLICCTKMPNSESVNQHLAGKRHKSSRKSFGCNVILQTKDNEYYCKSCDREIDDFENLYRHITSEEHLSCVDVTSIKISKDNRIETPSCPSTTPPRQDSSSFCQTAMPSCPKETPSCQNETPSCRNATPSWQDSSSFCQGSSPSCQDSSPFCQNAMPSCQNETPSCQNETPSCRNATPSWQDSSSFCQGSSSSCQDSSPFCQKETPSCQNGTPSWQNETPFRVNGTPSSQNETLSCENVTPSSQNETPSCQNASTSTEDYSCIYIVKRNAKKSICEICDDGQCLIAKKNIASHLASQKHKMALKRYGCENIVSRENCVYHCKCCDRVIPDLANVHLHIKEKKHMSSLIKVSYNQETQTRKRIFERPSTPEELHSHPQLQNLLSDYIVKEITTSTSGKILSRIIDSPIGTMDVHRPEYIANRSVNFVERNSFFNEPEMPKQPEFSTILSSMATDFSLLLKQIDETKKKRYSEKTHAREKNRQSKNTEFVEIARKIILCPICNFQATDLTSLHSHMAQHFSEEFMPKKRSKFHHFDTELCTSDCNHTEPLWQEYVTNNGNIQEPLNGQTTDNQESTFFHVSGNSSPKDDSIVTLEKIPPKKKQCSPKKTNIKQIMQHLDFDKDFIYDMCDKLAEIKLGFELCLVIDSTTIYCLICRDIVINKLDNYIDHLGSIDHCNYHDLMDNDRQRFSNVPQQFSDLDLAHEYMQEINDDVVRCILCDKDVKNNDASLIEHIYDKLHERGTEQMRANAIINFENVKSRIKCDWYSVQKYWCVVCRANMISEVNFVKHLESRKHMRNLRKSENNGKTMIFDFCSPCALLWYGYRCTYSYHSEIPTHKWLARDGHYALNELPIFAKSLLNEPEEWIDERIRYLDKISLVQRRREEILVCDLENIVKMKFPRAKAYTFGSRVTGLGSQESDIDVFLDCRNMYDGKESSESQILYYMNGVRQCLSKDPTSWDVGELLTNCRSPIIRALHRTTGLACDISFENGLSVENSKLIRTINYIFPPCRKLILILKQWLAYCDLSGSERITSYALCWYVIFYLQQESILPSIAHLIALKKKSQIIAGWETGVSHDFTYERGPGEMTIRDMLIRFFTFYADFEFRYDVACPLLGEIVKKRFFVDVWELPPEMSTYMTYMKYHVNAEPFRIDSPMCIQDPFDLQHNLTKAVSKASLNRFRTCCSKSLDLLWSNTRVVN